MPCSGHGVGLRLGCANCGGCAQRPGNNPLEWRYSVAITQGTFYPEAIKSSTIDGSRSFPWNIQGTDEVYSELEALATPVGSAWDTAVSHGSVTKNYSMDERNPKDHLVVLSYLITDYQLLQDAAEYWRYAAMFVGNGGYFIRVTRPDPTRAYLQPTSLSQLLIPKPGYLCSGEFELAHTCDGEYPSQKTRVRIVPFPPGVTRFCFKDQSWRSLTQIVDGRQIAHIQPGELRVRRRYVPTAGALRGIDTDDQLYPLDAAGGIHQSYTFTFAGADFGGSQFDNSDPASIQTTFTLGLSANLSNGLVWTSGDSSVPSGGHYAWMTMMAVFMGTQDTASSVTQTRFAWVPLAYAEFRTDDGHGFSYGTYGYLGGQWLPIGAHFNLYVLDTFTAEEALSNDRDYDFPRATLTVAKA